MTGTMTTFDAVPCTTAGHDCGCGCSDPVGLERTRFYPRQLIGPDELTQDQRWIRDKMRRHNRLLHGWGVVCGCNVRQAHDRQGRPIPWTVIVEPGDVLGPFGDDIVVDCETTFDLRSPEAASADCADPADPWCSDVRIARKPRQTLYLAIRYDERLTRPVRSMGGCGCGCDDHACEFSRIRETYALATLDELPPAYRRDGKDAVDPSTLLGALRCSPQLAQAVRPCPPCPTDPWVVLADIVADGDGTLAIDPVAHRRYVASFGAFWFACGPSTPVLEIRPNVWTPLQKARLIEKLDAAAVRVLDEQGGGVLDHVGDLAVISLKGVGRRSKLGKFLGARSLGDVVSTDRAAFVRAAVDSGVEETRSGEVWDAARAVIDTIR